MRFLSGGIFKKAALLLAVATVLSGTWILLGTTSVERCFLKMFLHRVERRTAMALRVEDLAWERDGQLSLFGVEAYEEGRLLASAPTVRISYRILAGEMAVDIREILVESPVVRVWKDHLDRRVSPEDHRNPGHGILSYGFVKILWDRCRITVVSGVMIGLDDSGQEVFRTRLSGDLSVPHLLPDVIYRKLY